MGGFYRGQAETGNADQKVYHTAVRDATLRARKRPKQRLSLLDAWFNPMVIGQELPTLLIRLAPALRVMLPLQTSHQETCRIPGIA